MKRTIISILIACSFSYTSFAQTTWSLEECIQHAIENNITVKKQMSTQKQKEIELSTAKNSRLPNLNGGVSQGFNFGRALQENNTYGNRNTQTTGFSLQTDIPLLTGMKIPNNIALSKLNLKAATEDLNKIKDDISIEVASSYIQVLFDDEIAKVAHNQVKMSEETYQQKDTYFKNGKAAESEVLEAKSQLEQDKMSAVQADNNYQLALLDLSQLLELKTPEGFNIVIPEIKDLFSNISLPNEVFQEAINSRPEIKASQYRLQGADKSIKIAQSAYFPQLNFEAGLNTNYYKITGMDNPSFSSQWHSHFAKYFSFNLSVPIFNRFSVRNSVRSSKVERTTLQWSLEESKKNLYKDIQKAYYNAIAAKSKYESSSVAYESANVSFNLMKEKYSLGKANITEYDKMRTNWLKTISDKIQAKYDYVFRTKILDFYKGEKLSFNQN